MRIIHRFSFNDNGEKREILNKLGVRYREIALPHPPNLALPLDLVIIDIEEPSTHWDIVLSLTREWDAIDYIDTQFTKSELGTAKLLKVTPDWHHGYPEPNNNDEYKEQTYDLRNACPKCAIGKHQKAPFRMKSEPKWGKKQVLQLNWIFDEYFVIPEVYEIVFKPFGIDYQEVLHPRTEKALKTVIQLRIDQVASCRLDLDGIEPQVCDECNKKKYLPHTRGMFPRLSRQFDAPIFKVQEYFGSGASAWRPIIITSEVYRSISANKLKGITFTPLELTAP